MTFFVFLEFILDLCGNRLLHSGIKTAQQLQGMSICSAAKRFSIPTDP
jgi:hypothetical protein